MAEDCTRCTSGIARRRAREIRRRMEAGRNGRNLGILVLTVPPELRARYAGGKLSREWANLQRTVNRRILKRLLGMDFGILTSHPTGDDGVTFHPHINALYFSTRRKTPFYPTGGRVWRAVREEWRRILRYKGDKALDVWHGYVKWDEREKVDHRLRYYPRPFPGWSWWRGQSYRWVGRRVKLDEVEKRPCPECGAKKHKLMGFVTFGIVLEWAATGKADHVLEDAMVPNLRDLFWSRCHEERGPPGAREGWG